MKKCDRSRAQSPIVSMELFIRIYEALYLLKLQQNYCFTWLILCTANGATWTHIRIRTFTVVSIIHCTTKNHSDDLSRARASREYFLSTVTTTSIETRVNGDARQLTVPVRLTWYTIHLIVYCNLSKENRKSLAFLRIRIQLSSLFELLFMFKNI